jgi:adenine-specific DNA glycosylase
LWRIAEELVVRAARHVEIEIEDEDEEGEKEKAARTWGGRCSRFNQSLMELGALVCLPRQPQCGLCPLAKDCVARKQGRVGELPEIGRRTPASRRRFVAFVLQKRGRFLVRQRPADVVNGHLWEFPNAEVAADESVEIRIPKVKTGTPKAFASEGKSEARNPKAGKIPGGAKKYSTMALRDGLASKGAAKSLFGAVPARLEPLCVIRHSITRYRITLEVFRATRERRFPGRTFEGRWLLRRELDELAFTGAHKKILRQL